MLMNGSGIGGRLKASLLQQYSGSVFTIANPTGS
jgi:hypothetical protein